ncbi:MAG TPA: TagF domain-containing protein [Candidatus Methylomirabilis sp.]|nr:TagF domain-containing protein [Candidatus Methylomirabilis sp.]
MLGSVGSAQGWQWVAFGKHPVARDFFRLGPDVPLAGGFSEWLESGHRALPTKPRSAAEFRSFRFWAKGPGKDGLVLGVIRDSSDDIGRPYPFFTMGAGPLKAWEKHWELLLLACEMPWGRIEHLSSGAIRDFRAMEIEVAERLRPPRPDWEQLRERLRSVSPLEPGSTPCHSSMDLEEMERCASRLTGETEIFLNLDAARGTDPVAAAALWTFLLRKRGSATPNAMFLGGGLGTPFLAVFSRALVPRDFVRLWTTLEGNGAVTP